MGPATTGSLRPRRELWWDRGERTPFRGARRARARGCDISKKSCPQKCVPLVVSFWHLGASRASDVGAGAAVVAPERRKDAAECRVVVERKRRASAAGTRRPETTWVGESHTGEALDFTRGCRSTRVVARRGDRLKPCHPARRFPARWTRSSRRMSSLTNARESLGRNTRCWSGTRSSASGRRRVSPREARPRRPRMDRNAPLPSPCVLP